MYKTTTTTSDEIETGLPPGDHTRAAARGIGAPTSRLGRLGRRRYNDYDRIDDRVCVCVCVCVCARVCTRG